MQEKNKVISTVMLRLKNGGFATIDAADYALVCQHEWFEMNGYVRTTVKGKRIHLHRFLLGVDASVPVVDHINGDRLDNRRTNLRPCTHRENLQNSRKKATASSRFKGVYMTKAKGRWRAMIAVNGKRHSLGYFDSEIEAARAYDAAALRFFGEFARQNFAE